MSWDDDEITSEEAEEMYYYFKSIYSSAASEHSASVRREQGYTYERSAARAEKDDCSTQKLNFEKRLEGIENIIRMLEGTGGWFSVSVPDTISKAINSIKKTDASYRQSIRMSGGMAAASLETAFKVKTVEEDYYSSSALQEYIAEKGRLEQRIAELKAKIAELSELITSLTGRINECIAEQKDLQRTMDSSALEMEFYRGLM